MGPDGSEPDLLNATHVPSVHAAPPPPGPRLAHVGRRILAAVLDVVFAGLVFGIVYAVGIAFLDLPQGVLRPQDPMFSVVLRQVLTVLAVALACQLAYVVAMLVWEGRAGRTLGHLLLRMRVQNVDDGRRIGVGRAFLRYLVVAACSLIPVAGPILVLLSPLWDASGRRQGWHDKAARSVVVDVVKPVARVDDGMVAAAAPPVAAPPVAAKPAPDPVVPAAPVAPPSPVAPEEPPVSPAIPAEALAGVVPDVPAVEADAEGEAEAEVEAETEPASTGVELELGSGARTTIDGPVRIGRNPQAAPGEDVRLIRIEDPGRSVSKNHADLGVDEAGLWLADRGSSNGTVIATIGGRPRVAEPGVRTRVPLGATIHVGDCRLVVHPRRDA